MKIAFFAAIVFGPVEASAEISPSVFSGSRQHVETNVLSAAIDVTGWSSGSSLEMKGFIRARLVEFDGRRRC